MKIVPTELKRIIETSAVLKSNTVFYNEISLIFTEYGIRSWMIGTYNLGVFNDYELKYKPEDELVNREIVVRSEELYKMVKNNFRVDDIIDLNIIDNKLILKGSRDKLEVLLSNVEVKKPTIEGFKNIGGVEFPITKKGFLPKIIYKTDSGYLKEVEIENDSITFVIDNNKIMVELMGETYSLIKDIPIILSHGSIDSVQKYTIPKNIFNTITGLLEGTIYFGFLGYDDENMPMPFFITQREQGRSFKISYFIAPMLV